MKLTVVIIVFSSNYPGAVCYVYKRSSISLDVVIMSRKSQFKKIKTKDGETYRPKRICIVGSVLTVYGSLAVIAIPIVSDLSV